MECPRCQAPSRVLESRRAERGGAIRRRRACSSCGHRFTTYERREAEPIAVVKRGGERQRFDRTKLRAALLRAAHKRPVSAEDVEALVDRVELAGAEGGGELTAAQISELCLGGLRDLDDGAYLQYAGTLPTAKADFAESGRGSSVRAPRKSAKLPA